MIVTQQQLIQTYAGKLYLAFDFSSRDMIDEKLAELTVASVGIKLGMQPFLLGGPKLVRQLVDAGWSVFLDLKFHDIPRTMLYSVQLAADLGVEWLTVHASAGYQALSSCQAWLTQHQLQTKILGVTCLTSFDARTLVEIGVHNKPVIWVEQLAKLCLQAQLAGCVCSVEEIKIIKQLSQSLCCMVPGIRTQSFNGADDQRRTATPQQAFAQAADYLVMGRSFWQLAKGSSQ